MLSKTFGIVAALVGATQFNIFIAMSIALDSHNPGVQIKLFQSMILASGGKWYTVVGLNNKLVRLKTSVPISH